MSSSKSEPKGVRRSSALLKDSPRWRTPHKVLFVMRRKLFNLVPVVSLLLCVISAVLWARSYCVGDQVVFSCGGADGTHPWHELGLVHASGDFAIARITCMQPILRGGWYYFRAGTIRLGAVGGQSGGLFGYGLRTVTVPSPGPKVTMDMFLLPYWLPTAIAGIAPAWWLLNLLRRPVALRCADGRCTTCGYDLRATPDRCPECGRAPKWPSNPAPIKPSPAQG